MAEQRHCWGRQFSQRLGCSHHFPKEVQAAPSDSQCQHAPICSHPLPRLPALSLTMLTLCASEIGAQWEIRRLGRPLRGRVLRSPRTTSSTTNSRRCCLWHLGPQTPRGAAVALSSAALNHPPKEHMPLGQDTLRN